MFKKYYIAIIVLLTLTFSLAPQLVIAQGTGSTLPCSDITGCLNDAAGEQGAGYDTTQDETRLARIIGLIVRAFLSLVGIIFISYIVYGGFLWMTAAGNEDRMSKAKSIIRNGIIGLIIILSAAAIYALVDSIITGGNNIPTAS